MKRTHGLFSAGAIALSAVLGFGVGVGRAQQEQPPAKKAGEKFDEATQAIKKGLQSARDTVREQFAKARESIHNMSIESRVYGRLHWDKALSSSTLNLTVEGGVVTLRGSVPDAKAKHKAVDLAMDTVGVTKVIDQLAIEPTPHTDSGSTPARTPRPR